MLHRVSQSVQVTYPFGKEKVQFAFSDLDTVRKVQVFLALQTLAPLGSGARLGRFVKFSESTDPETPLSTHSGLIQKSDFLGLLRQTRRPVMRRQETILVLVDAAEERIQAVVE